MKKLNNLIQRMQSLETSLGIEEINVSGFIEEWDENKDSVNIICEVIGNEIKQDFRVVASIYDDVNDIVGSGDYIIDSDNFEGIDSFSFSVEIPIGCKLSKIKIYPVKM